MSEGMVVFVRGIIAFFSLLIFARLLGKKQISQLTLFDYILGITVGSMAASITTDLNSCAWPHWVGLLTWVAAGLAIDFLTTKSRYASKLIEGEPTIIIMNGKILENNMRKLRYNATNLMQQLRSKDIFDMSEVHYAILEANGELTVLKKPELQPLTPKDMNITVPNTGIGIELIYVDSRRSQPQTDKPGPQVVKSTAEKAGRKGSCRSIFSYL
jgi:uncharacterized membrane protein YcaP (DUF421 family)